MRVNHMEWKPVERTAICRICGEDIHKGSLSVGFRNVLMIGKFVTFLMHPHCFLDEVKRVGFDIVEKR